ncbi:MAG TPA: ATP synthase F1 subunit epsilon [Candidatus Ventrousia excrementavium]|uniref:ATP synthase epsilon chain n=1 Tax=Candidatus Ventrousia excrementavium TaxID=2840961 RepID=A0A9D1LL35_9CLOT|nr:ATP synthase F1 subunit epsilon [Candidatus Ventrousia excrementavium]
MAVFHLQIVTADGLCFDGEAESILVRTIDGDVCILARHIDYVTALGYGEARVTVDGKTRRAACMGGMLAVTGGRVRVVASAFEWREDIDVTRAQNALERAQTALAAAESKDEKGFASAAIKRAQVRLRVAQQ